MGNELKENLKRCCKMLSADSFKKGESWKGFDVYEPIYETEVEIGFPRVILVKGNDARLSSIEDCFLYMKHLKNSKIKSVAI